MDSAALDVYAYKNDAVELKPFILLAFTTYNFIMRLLISVLLLEFVAYAYGGCGCLKVSQKKILV